MTWFYACSPKLSAAEHLKKWSERHYLHVEDWSSQYCFWLLLYRTVEITFLKVSFFHR